MYRLALAASLIFATATLAHAQSAAPPNRTVGDTWKYTSGPGEVRVVKVDDNGYTVVALGAPCPRCLRVFDKEFTLLGVFDGDGKPADLTKLGFLGIGFKFYQWPLEVGKKWKIEGHGLFRGNNVPYIIECWVSAFEDVKTKAGTFKAYRIDRDWSIRVSDRTPPTWKDTTWYAPDVKGTIKFEGNRNEWELESYKLNQ